jgi:serine protease Do/serine protease DegQ
MYRSVRRLLSAVLFGLVLLSFAGCGHDKKETSLQSSVRDVAVQPPVKKPPKEIVATQEAFIEVSHKVMPSVVNIRAASVRPVGDLNPLFRQFFGDIFKNHPPITRKEQSLGSGFIISADGYILTNAHVVKGADEIKVKLSDESVYTGKVVGIDPRTDIAVIKIAAKEKLTPAVLGDSDKIRVGQWALAIGNPFGLGRTLTVGVISATGRSNVGIEDYEDFIQTDASINPGNSGGPLLDIYGEVVGVNTAIVASGQGIGFAIPVNLAKLIANQLIEHGKVTRGWLGVSIQPLTPELAESFGLEKVTGALINQVLPGSPAQKAGLKQGDVLLRFDGREIAGVRQLQLVVANTPPGKTVPVEVLRDGKHVTLSVSVVVQKKTEEETAAPTPSGQGQELGMSVSSTPGGHGVQVETVSPDSNAADAGVRPGDIILSVNRMDIHDPASFATAVRKAKEAKNVVLLIRRGDTTIYLAFPPS